MQLALQLMTAGNVRYPVLTISPWLERHRTEYQDGLLRVSQTGRWGVVGGVKVVKIVVDPSQAAG